MSGGLSADVAHFDFGDPGGNRCSALGVAVAPVGPDTIDGLVESFVVGALPEDLAQVCAVCREQAGVEGAGGAALVPLWDQSSDGLGLSREDGEGGGDFESAYSQEQHVSFCRLHTRARWPTRVHER